MRSTPQWSTAGPVGASKCSIKPTISKELPLHRACLCAFWPTTKMCGVLLIIHLEKGEESSNIFIFAVISLIKGVFPHRRVWQKTQDRVKSQPGISNTATAAARWGHLGNLNCATAVSLLSGFSFYSVSIASITRITSHRFHFDHSSCLYSLLPVIHKSLQPPSVLPGHSFSSFLTSLPPK